MLVPMPSPCTGSEGPPEELQESGGVRLPTGPTGQVFRPVGPVLKEFQVTGAGVRSPPRVVPSALLSEGVECRSPVESLLPQLKQLLRVEGTEQALLLVMELLIHKFLEPTPGPLAQILGLRVQERLVLPLGELPLGEPEVGLPDCRGSDREALRRWSMRMGSSGLGINRPAPEQLQGLQVEEEPQRG